MLDAGCAKEKSYSDAECTNVRKVLVDRTLVEAEAEAGAGLETAPLYIGREAVTHFRTFPVQESSQANSTECS